MPDEKLKLTYDDYCALPDDGRRYELLDGELSLTPSPGTPHQRTCRDLGLLLEAHVRQRRLGEVLFAPCDVILDRSTVVQPDILFVEASRADLVTDRAVEGPPTLAVEVVSPSSPRIDRLIKPAPYARFGVLHLWIVDPVARTIEGRDLATGALARIEWPAVGRLAPFGDLEIDLRAIWPG